jgi:deoxyribonuclease-4
MLTIGCHLSASQGYLHMGQEILSLGGNTFQFFTRNPRGGSVKPLDLADCAAYRDFAVANGIGEIVAHAPYTINACSDKDTVRDFARRAMSEDLARLEEIPGALYNFHPGSHVGQGLEVGIEQIAEILNAVLTPDTHTTVLLETMAGKGSEVGGRFEELREILDRVTLSDRMGVCLDTCHVSDAGYDIIGDLDGVLAEFDRVVGLSRLRALHLNDSKNPAGAHKDRHEKIGDGALGKDTFAHIVNHPVLSKLPMVLETPNDLPGYAAEIALLRSLHKE